MERRQRRSLTEEYRRQAVELVLGHKTAIALDQIGAAAMIGADGLQQILRVEPCRECCRTDEVAEHDRQLPALGGIVWPRLGHSGWLRREQGVTRKLAALPFPFRQVSKGQRTCPIAPEQLKRGHRSKVRNGPKPVKLRPSICCPVCPRRQTFSVMSARRKNCVGVWTGKDPFFVDEIEKAYCTDCLLERP
jgi:hypothetical protein